MSAQKLTRPALVIQSDLFSAYTRVTVLLFTSTLVDTPLLRVTIQPHTDNGLQRTSQVMIDKAMTVTREKLGLVFGSLDAENLVQVDRCLSVFLGIVK
ncbi:type II toxin-antitoxin system PemK/MazF family toxin [Acidithiobacillus sp. IBUN Pt1247-S3]|uniref:type II toxin-antitoxin system PemK/MazF family toxin n=1 Tax=Acidithiobacillus sp. IBUN Pt1247-S3 TaxID=3166642 RepID=UPI0034E399BA